MAGWPSGKYTPSTSDNALHKKRHASTNGAAAGGGRRLEAVVDVSGRVPNTRAAAYLVHDYRGKVAARNQWVAAVGHVRSRRVVRHWIVGKRYVVTVCNHNIHELAAGKDQFNKASTPRAHKRRRRAVDVLQSRAKFCGSGLVLGTHLHRRVSKRNVERGGLTVSKVTETIT